LKVKSNRPRKIKSEGEKMILIIQQRRRKEMSRLRKKKPEWRI
jgi:hypothetical protein